MTREATTLHPAWTNHVHNNMVGDALGSIAAVLAFTVVLYAPGYLAAYATDLFNFRQKGFTDRSLWAIAVSFCLAPIAAHLVGRAAGLRGVVWLFVLCAAAAAILLVTASDNQWSTRDRRITALFALGLTAATILLLVDLQIGHKLYFSVVMADQSYRIAFTDAVARTGIPPANPLYFAGAPAPMRYFYFWYVLCAAVMKVAHVSARQAFTASTAWAGFGLVATVHLFTCHFFRWQRKQRWIALGILVVTGADLVPSLGQAILQPTLNGNTEWWSVDPIFAWPDSLLWVPHHVASVLCCLLGFLFLWQMLQTQSAQSPHELRPPRRPTSRPILSTGTAQPHSEEISDLPSAPASTGGKTFAPTLLAAAAFASAFGLSVYVAFGFALLMAAWLLRLWILHHPRRAFITNRVAIATVVTALISAPFLHELASGPSHRTSTAASRAAPAPHLFLLSVRRMIDSELLTGLPLFTNLNRTHPVLLDQSIRLALLLPGLAMELGLYGAVLVLLLLARRRTPAANPHDAHSTALFFTVSGLVMTMFLSSSIITNNDFGYRAVMLPQFFLLLLTAEVLGSWRRVGVPSAAIQPTPARRRLLYALLLLGVAGTAWWAFLLRAWLPIEAANPQSGFTESPADEFQIREAFDVLHRVAPANAVVAFRPIDPVADRKGAVMVPNEFYQRMLVMDAGRQILNAEGKCAVHFGGDPAVCPEIQAATARLYASPAPSGDWARSYCTRFGVQFLVVSAWDPDWHSPTGWPATLLRIAQEPRFAILQCR